jgi:hypothetical protein
MEVSEQPPKILLTWSQQLTPDEALASLVILSAFIAMLETAIRASTKPEGEAGE